MPGMGPRERSWEGDSIWLAYCGSWVDVGPRNTHAVKGVLFIPKQGPLMTFAVSSHFTYHLSEIWPDAFYIMSQVTPVGDNIKRHAPGPYSQTMPFTGGITKASDLGNELTSTYWCRKVSCTARGQFHCYTCNLASIKSINFEIFFALLNSY